MCEIDPKCYASYECILVYFYIFVFENDVENLLSIKSDTHKKSPVLIFTVFAVYSRNVMQFEIYCFRVNSWKCKNLQKNMLPYVRSIYRPCTGIEILNRREKITVR